MTPNLPLSPQQRQQRRKNILFTLGCTGAAVGMLAFVFFSGGKTKEPEDAPPPAETQQQAPQPKEASPYDNQFHDRELAEETANAATEGEPQEAVTESGLTEAELAKLPPWQAGFERLSREQRVAYATAFTRAKEAYAAKQWSNCLSLLNDCDPIYDQLPDLWNLRSCALLAANEPAEAEACIQRSLSINPDDLVALMAQSEMQMLRRDFAGSISSLERLRRNHQGEANRELCDTFTFHQLLCHLMLRQEMEARALVSGLSPLSDSPLYYFSQAAFCIYKGDNEKALQELRSATSIYGNGGATASYHKWLGKCGLAEKYTPH